MVAYARREGGAAGVDVARAGLTMLPDPSKGADAARLLLTLSELAAARADWVRVRWWGVDQLLLCNARMWRRATCGSTPLKTTNPLHNNRRRQHLWLRRRRPPRLL
jgi:hypothetical protein